MLRATSFSLAEEQQKLKRTFWNITGSFIACADLVDYGPRTIEVIEIQMIISIDNS